MGAADSDIDKGGSGYLDIRKYLLGGSAIGRAVWVRYMGPDATHEEGIGGIPLWGSPQDDGATTAESSVWRLGLTPAGGCDGGGGFSGGGDLRLPPPEHSSAIYCNKDYYGNMSRRKSESRAKCGNAMVGTGGFGFEGDQAASEKIMNMGWKLYQGKRRLPSKTTGNQKIPIFRYMKRDGLRS